jgi:hypothetical protein
VARPDPISPTGAGMDPETADVIARLEAYNRRFGELLDMLTGRLPLTGDAKTLAQERLKVLKNDLGAEYKQMSTARGKAALNQVERSYYYPTIHQTFVEIYVAVNTVPDAKWHSVLYGARINITHTLHQLHRE